MSTTHQVFDAYQKQYDFFNKKLFGNQLPDCLLNFSRKGKTWGFFAPKRWEQADLVKHEISLNPSTLKLRKQEDISSTLVHEMCHLWQQEFGTPGKRGFHNRQWGGKMIEVGLVPSRTGLPGGKKTGIQMTHYSEKDGVFEKSFAEMPKEFQFPWLAFDPLIAAKAKQTRVKYTCRGCDANVWGKPDLMIKCVDCDTVMVAVNV